MEALDETLVARRTANVRALPTASSQKAGRLSEGTAVEVTGKTRYEGKDWYRVAYSGRQAWVFGTLLEPRSTPMVSLAQKKTSPPAKKPGDTFKDCDTCPEMVVIPPGSFKMGDLSGDGTNDEKPVHNVRIGYSFAVGKYEVTQDEWVAVMGSNPSRFKGLLEGRSIPCMSKRQGRRNQ